MVVVAAMVVVAMGHARAVVVAIDSLLMVVRVMVVLATAEALVVVVGTVVGLGMARVNQVVGAA